MAAPTSYSELILQHTLVREALHNLTGQHTDKKKVKDFCSVCSAQTLAHKPALRRPNPQKYTYSYHGNKCLKGNARSVTKVTLEGQDKSQRDIKDT